MAEDNPHIADLMAYRQKFVAFRRERVAEYLGSNTPAKIRSQLPEAIRNIQTTIEAVDRMIADEEAHQMPPTIAEKKAAPRNATEHGMGVADRAASAASQPKVNRTRPK